MFGGRGLAEACGNRTHPGRLSATRNGFEARENHQAPFASNRLEHYRTGIRTVNECFGKIHFPLSLTNASQ